MYLFKTSHNHKFLTRTECSSSFICLFIYIIITGPTNFYTKNTLYEHVVAEYTAAIAYSDCDPDCMMYNLTVLYYNNVHNIYVKHSWMHIQHLQWVAESFMQGIQITVDKRRSQLSCLACPMEMVVSATLDNSLQSKATIKKSLSVESNDITVSSESGIHRYKIFPPR